MIDKILLGHLLEKHRFGDRNDNGGGPWISPSTACRKVCCILSDRHRMSNQVDHFAISRFRSCLLDTRNKRGVDIGVERDHSQSFTLVGSCDSSISAMSSSMIQLLLDSGGAVLQIVRLRSVD